jgi:hypothetical protein
VVLGNRVQGLEREGTEREGESLIDSHGAGGSQWRSGAIIPKCPPLMMMLLRRGNVNNEDDDTAVTNDPTFSQQPKQQLEPLWHLPVLRSFMLFAPATSSGPTIPYLICLPFCLPFI